MLVDNTGQIRDFFACGNTAAEIATDITGDREGLHADPVAQGAWSGARRRGVLCLHSSAAAHGNGRHRRCSTDWSIGASSWGAQNAALTLPFPLPASVSVPVAPTSVPFTDGIFSGNVQVGAVGSSIRLTADDGSGHTGLSNAFDTLPPPPVIISPTSVLAVIGQSFSYQIHATNFPGNYDATNLPNGLHGEHNDGPRFRNAQRDWHEFRAALGHQPQLHRQRHAYPAGASRRRWRWHG